MLLSDSSRMVPRLVSLAAELQDGVAVVAAALDPQRVAGQVVRGQRRRGPRDQDRRGGRRGRRLQERAADDITVAGDRAAVGLVGPLDVQVVGGGVDRRLVVGRAGDDPLAAAAGP